MAVVGIDFGTLHSKIGVARHRGIDIVTNEVSNRSTPSLVAFGPKQRAIGEAAKTQETSNFKNTVGSLKRCLGRTLNDVQIQNYEKKFINAKLVDVNGQVGTEVTFLGEKQQFSYTQLVGMYLGKLRDIAAAELKSNVSDVVISVPGWYTDIQRRALLDAGALANLNVLRLINDTTATALGYGITKSDLPDIDNPRHVVFVDCGHAELSVAVVAFSKGRLDIKATAYDNNVGGRDIDWALVQHFSKEFDKKYGLDIMSSPKAIFRLTAGCEKLKKILSANTEAIINVESIQNDVDATSKLTREELEQLIAPLLDRIQAPIERALRDSGITAEQVDAIELVGGTTRVPAVKQRIMNAVGGKALSYTLNQDEAVARGATFACAMLSPTFRVREFAVHDINHFPIKVQWERVPEDQDEETELLVFPQGNAIPSTKVLSFYRKEPFQIQAAYANPDLLPGSINPWIANFTAKEVAPLPNGDPAVVKVKTRLNLHGIMSFEAAYTEEIEEKEEVVSTPSPAPMDVDGAAAPAAEGEQPAAPPQPVVKKKKVVRKKEVAFVASNSSLTREVVEEWREKEGQMYESDKLVRDTEERKNALEEYIYDMRSKVEDRFASFVQASEKSTLLAALQEAEDWLYSEEGEDTTKSIYISKLDALKKIGDPITFRYRESQDRNTAIAALRETLNTYMSQATSSDEKYSHIDEKDKQSVVEKVATVQKWLEDMIVKQAERPKNEDPVLTSGEVAKKRDEVIYFATPILTRLKPKVNTTPPSGEQQQGEKKEEGKGKEQGPSEMDVD
ncbi:heat shock protein [Coprinopsis cinerea okayama7|uniref:Heat shock protein n=1 Tax=Coprinopsis cinerea (strain Okayama-7 / 130 / ATCC MYA-4618 / FGSC 9003) TaxID=240176 RepID=A8N845_COPC7|nr:heat shock protein [Coprinopsis cinerea okayama7\|eukprot:XP_001831001.1 heat shock protein [Coprinopsis cinerea okayama7\